jgi:hypothetical protein
MQGRDKNRHNIFWILDFGFWIEGAKKKSQKRQEIMDTGILKQIDTKGPEA